MLYLYNITIQINLIHSGTELTTDDAKTFFACQLHGKFSVVLWMEEKEFIQIVLYNVVLMYTFHAGADIYSPISFLLTYFLACVRRAQVEFAFPPVMCLCIVDVREDNSKLISGIT